MEFKPFPIGKTTPQRKPRPVKFGLRTKFLGAFFLLILFPFLTLGILIYRQSAAIIEKNASRYTLETMRQISKNVDYNLQEMERITQFLTINEDLLAALNSYHALPNLKKVGVADQINRALLNLSGLRSELSGLYLFDNYGNFFYTRGRSPRLGYRYQRERWYRETIAKAGSIHIIGTHLQYHVQNKPSLVISIARAVRNFATRETVGVMLVDFNYRILEGIIGTEMNNAFSAGELFILDPRENIIYHQNRRLLTKRFNYQFAPKIQRRDTGSFIAKIGSGAHSRQMFVVFYTSPYSAWKIVHLTPLNYLLKEIIIIRNSLVLIMFICLFIAFLLSLEVSYKLVEPIKELVGMMTEVEQGNFSASIAIRTRDETGLLAASFNSMTANIKNLIEKVYHAKLRQKEAELNALQSQINPHFLYNTLESIRGVAIAAGVPEIARMAKSLSSLFRYNICKGKEIVTVKEEIEHVKNYILIQNFRYEGKFAVEYQIAPAVNNAPILKLILQPLVENAIQHGLEPKLGQGIIMISCQKSGAMLHLSVADDGVGMSATKIAELNRLLESDTGFSDRQNDGEDRGDHQSIGIFNVNSRIKLYYGAEYGLRYTSRESGGTVAVITLPAPDQAS